MTTSWEALFDRAAATDGTTDIETIRAELELARKREREREREREHQQEDTDA